MRSAVKKRDPFRVYRPDIVAQVREMWASGFNTADIADLVFCYEADVWRVVCNRGDQTEPLRKTKKGWAYQ